MAEVKEAPTPKNVAKQGPSKEIASQAKPMAQQTMVSPFTFMRRFAEEMDHLFEDFGLEARHHVPSLFSRGREALRREAGFIPAQWSPRVDVQHCGDQLMIRADLPGLAKEDVEVDVTDDVLTIRGERKQEKKEEHEGYLYSECNYGRFFRAIPLPEGADAAKASADFKQGVLEIKVPVSNHHEHKPHRLEIHEAK